MLFYLTDVDLKVTKMKVEARSVLLLLHMHLGGVTLWTSDYGTRWQLFSMSFPPTGRADG